MPPEILDTDLFVVNRDDVTYKVSAEDLNLTGPKPINPGPDQIVIDPPVSGDGTENDPFVLTPSTVDYGGTVYSVEEITIVGQKGGDLVIFVDDNAATNGDRYNQPIGTIIEDTDYVTKLRFSDVPASTAEQTFVGKLKLADTVIYFQWQVSVEAGTEAPVLNAVTLVATGTDDSKRFEDQSFHTTLDIDEGKPVSTKSIAYKVAGTLSVTPTTSEIVGEEKVSTDYSDSLNIITLGNLGEYNTPDYAFNGEPNQYGVSHFSFSFPDIPYDSALGGIMIQTAYGLNDAGGATGYLVRVNDGDWYNLAGVGPDPTWNNINDGSDFPWAIDGNNNVFKITPQSEVGVLKKLDFMHTNNSATWDSTTGKVTSVPVVTPSSYFRLEAVYVNEKILLDETFTKLTLADNTDLDKFTVGELVQQNAPVVASDVSVFSTTLYTGNNSTPRLISTGIDNTDKSLIWIKGRGGSEYSATTNGHFLLDSERENFNAYLQSSENDPESSMPVGTIVPESSGFTISDYTANFNKTNVDFVAWNFRAVPGFLDIQTWTGTDGAPRVLPHSLQATPGFIITKCSSTAGTEWHLYHKSLGLDKRLAFTSSPAADSVGSWQDITSTTFGFGIPANLNAAGRTHVAYLFADTPGLIKCGDYEGNGSSAGPTVDCGFEPQWLMIKRTDVANSWAMYDSARNPSNPRNTRLQADTTSPDNTSSNIGIDFISNGFQIVGDAVSINANLGNYVYVAIAKNAVADLAVTPAGLFQSYDDTTNPAAPTMTLTPQTDGWSANTGNYAVGEENILDNATLYLETNNLRQVTGTSSAPVYYDTTATTDEVTFDLPPGTGQSWDDELPDGTTIEACAHADNTAAGGGRSPLTGDICSDKLQPEADADYEKALGGLTTLYSGTGAEQDIVNGINLATNGGLVWIKERSGTRAHQLVDTTAPPVLNGPNYDVPTLESHLTSPRSNYSNTLISFNSDGFTLGSGGNTNFSASEFVAWTFQKAPGYFDIQTWSGTGVAGKTVTHDLGSVPALIITKSLSGTLPATSWYTYSKELGNDAYLRLDTNDAAYMGPSTMWNNTDPTSSEFTLGPAGQSVNESGTEYIAYLFADTPGLIKCGSYPAAGVPNTIDVGFKPQWVMIKASSRAGHWLIFDRPRGESYIKANEAEVESAPYSGFEWTDSGFSLTDQSGGSNSPGETYIYVAIAAPVVRNLTQDEVDATKLLFETREFRQIKHEQDTVARAAELRANFEARGFTTAEIDEVLD